MSEEDIVISGYSCRYPGISNGEKLSAFVRSAKTRDETKTEIVKDQLDTGQFCVHAHQAENCDPQIRVLLHCAREALAEARLAPSAVVGVVVGCEVSDYGESVGFDIARDLSALSGYGVLGGCRAMVANRISFECNLTGTVRRNYIIVYLEEKSSSCNPRGAPL